LLFNSATYLLFMLLAAPLVGLGPGWLRRGVMLGGSLMFYAFWRVDFTLLVVFSAMIDFIASQRIHASTNAAVRRIWLSVSLCMNLGLLVFFKYTYFIVGSTQSIFYWLGVPFEVDLPQIILPLGISFYTFQTISYTIDVYRGTQVPVKGFGLFLTYVTFWPQLVAGPVLRAHEVIPQLSMYKRPRTGDVVLGVEEILHGLFKKVVLADSISSVVDYGFSQQVSGLGTLDIWTLTFAFGMQIYFDFSGYSQIAIGSARCMGCRFPDNFNWPYLATSPRDFWKRWHISLSAWIRDYLYLPLQGARFRGGSTGGIEADGSTQASELRRTGTLFLTWFIMGLWHGASWSFALWGLWHAVMILIYRITKPITKELPLIIRVIGGWIWTVPLMMLGWAFFRAQSLDSALAMVAKAFDLTDITRMSLRENQYLIVFIYFAGLLMLAAVLRLQRGRMLRGAGAYVRYAALAIANGVMSFSIIIMLRQLNQFIYFQF